MTTAMTDPDGRTALLRLLTWLSPAFPIGAFSYSHGVETAINAGVIQSAETAKEWLQGVLNHGSGWNDLLVLGQSHAAATENDSARLAEVNSLCLAMAPSAERYLETQRQGTAFLTYAQPWIGQSDPMAAAVGKSAALPVAVGLAAARTHIPLEELKLGYLQSFTSNLVSVCLRLVPLGQTEGVQLLADLEQTFVNLSERSQGATLDALGSAAILSDIASMAHETEPTRIFRS